MTNVDERIRGAMDSDDREFLASMSEDRGVFRQLGDSFHGPMKGWTILINILTFLVTMLGIYAIWGFVNAEGTDSLIRWAALGWAAWTIQIALKGWLLDRINMLNILREIKRLELRIAMQEETRA